MTSRQLSKGTQIGRRRRVIGKAEWTRGEANPRFIVTNVHEAFGIARFASAKV